MVVKLLTERLDCITSQDIGDSLPLDRVKHEGNPVRLHLIHVILHSELSEGKVSLAFQELDVLFCVLHRLKRLLGDVSLFAHANFLGHFGDMSFFETLGCETTNDRDLFLELHEEVFLAFGETCQLSSLPLGGELVLKATHRGVELFPLRLDLS